MENNCRFYCYRKTRKQNKKTNLKMKKLKLTLFDMDGVLADTISSWKYIHDYFNTCNEKSVNQYLQGKIDDLEFIKRDSQLWKENNKPIKKQKLQQILKNVPIMKGAKKTIQTLKKNDVQTAIISAGLDILAERLQKELQIDHIYSNGIQTDTEGRLTNQGILNVRLMYKDETVQKISKQLHIPQCNIASVGNSCFDIPMFETTGLGIAFNPEDKCAEEAADIIIKGKDLTKILPHLQGYI
jgi:phosphoserine phosphatase